MKQSVLPPFDVSRETRERLAFFASLVVRWSKRINLVSKADVDNIWTRHIEDSLQLAPLLEPHTQPAIDIGSGGGFPGLVLAIATGHTFHLVESDQRKATFLREAARQVDAPVQIHPARIETVQLAPASMVTARALAPLSRLISLTDRLLKQDGTCLFLKGKSAVRELTDAKKDWHMRVTIWHSRTDDHGCILQLTDILPVQQSSA